MEAKRPRVLAICLFSAGSTVLMSRGEDRATGEVFFRPFGGGVEWGEHSTATIAREIREELGAGIHSITLLDVIENIFEFENKSFHEIVFIYHAHFEDLAMYDKPLIERIDSVSESHGVWLDVADAMSGKAKLVPDGLDAILARIFP